MYYLAVTMLVLFFAVSTYFARHVRVRFFKKQVSKCKIWDYSNRFGFIFPVSIILILFSGLRANMGTDYVTYQYIFENTISSLNWHDVLDKREPLFVAVQKIVGDLFGYDTVHLMIVLAAITVFFLCVFFKNESRSVWLCLFAVLTIGSFFTSFNTTRIYLASVLWACTVPFIYKNKPLQYVILTIIISLIHLGTLAMIPMYWLLKIDWIGKYNSWLGFFLGSAVLVTLGANYIVSFIGKLPFLSVIITRAGGYFTSDSTGGTSIFSVIRPLFIFFIILLSNSSHNKEQNRNVIWNNGALYFLTIQVMSLKYYIFYRFTYFMIPLAIVGLVNSVYLDNKRNNELFVLILVFCFVWGIFGGLFSLEYSFYWQ